METQPADKAKRALRRRQPLLVAWLDALDRHDNPARRRVTKLRQTQRQCREIPVTHWTRPTDFGCRQGHMPTQCRNTMSIPESWTQGRRANPAKSGSPSIGTKTGLARLTHMAKFFLALIATGLLLLIVGFVWVAFML